MSNFFNAMSLSSSGLSSQRTRLNVVSSNIANINTTRTPEGGPYRRKQTVIAALPDGNTFLDELRGAEGKSAGGTSPNADLINGTRHARVVGISEDAREPMMKFDPSHPDANEEGYVALPNIDIYEEMVDLMQARTTYEANANAFNVTKMMAGKALELGK